MIYTSIDFQCPDTGVPVILVYDEDRYEVTAAICSSVWDYWKNQGAYSGEVFEEEEKETQEWCDKFSEIAFDVDAANEVAEKYDVWF